MSTLLLDTGPLVAFLSARDAHHAWARDLLDAIEPPLFTCEAVLAESCFLLRKHRGASDAILSLLSRGILRCTFRAASEADALRDLLKRFASVPMSFADACLVRMSELDAKSAVLTLDTDFHIYRRHRRQAIPVITPESTR